MIHVHFRDRVVEFEMERNLTKWEGNNKMFNKFKKSIKQKFKLKTHFSIYDPNDDMFVDDMDDLCGCYIGYEDDFSFILSLHVKADNEPEHEDEIESPPPPSKSNEDQKHEKEKTPPSSSTNGSKKGKKFKVPSLLTKTIETEENKQNDISPPSKSKSPSPQQEQKQTQQKQRTPSPKKQSPSPPRFIDTIQEKENKPPPSLNMDDIEPIANLRSMEEVKPELQIERRKSKRESIDMSVFTDSEHCEVNSVWLQFGAKRIKKCDYVNRLVTGLKYYTNLDCERNEVDKDDFTSFFMDTYSNMLDDYLHVLKVHNMDLEEIHDSLFTKFKFKTKPDICKCRYTARHFKGDKVYNKDDEAELNFYIETYDSLYYYLFHLFTVGLRSTKKEIKSDSNKSPKTSSKTPKTPKSRSPSPKTPKTPKLPPIEIPDDVELTECFDIAFAKMIQRTNIKKQNTKGLFERYNKCKKFDLQITDSTEDTVSNNPITRDRDSERLTFKDSLMIYVQKCMKGYSNNAAVTNLFEFVNNEGYDTDAIIMDIVEGHAKFSNIKNVLNNQSCVAAIKQYIRNTKRMSFISTVTNVNTSYLDILCIILHVFVCYNYNQCHHRHSALV